MTAVGVDGDDLVTTVAEPDECDLCAVAREDGKTVDLRTGHDGSDVVRGRINGGDVAALDDRQAAVERGAERHGNAALRAHGWFPNDLLLERGYVKIDIHGRPG